MTNNSPTPEQQPETILNPMQLESTKPLDVDLIRAAEVLGGIGLGETNAIGLPPNSPSVPSTQEPVSTAENMSNEAIISQIKSQTQASFAGYTSAAEALPPGRADRNIRISTFESILDDTLSQLSQNGSLKFIRKQFNTAPPRKYDLVAVPNGTLLFENIEDLMQDFVGQSGVVSVDPTIRDFSPFKLSGPSLDTDQPVRFVLIPDKPKTISNFKGTVSEHLKYMEDHRKTQAHVFTPSIMETMFWLYKKRAELRIKRDDPAAWLPAQIYMSHLAESSLAGPLSSPLGKVAHTPQTVYTLFKDQNQDNSGFRWKQALRLTNAIQADDQSFSLNLSLSVGR